tara:strand:- start:40 stop:567 length:528 start_codon:yes stop_codon:yes gene_type:complete
MKSSYNNKAVFFDRDGVINHLIYRDNGFYSPRFLKDFQLYEDVVGAIKFLKKKSFYIIIISNQPDISRNNMNREELQKIDDFLNENLKINDIYYSFDSDVIEGGSKKPLPTMIFNAQKKWEINLSESYFIGDSQVDIECAQNANVPFVLIKREHNKKLEYHCSIDTLRDIKKIVL